MHRISIQRSGTTFDVARDETILAAATRCGIWLRHRCGNGSCGTCLARLVSGRVRNGFAPTAEMSPDDVCLCVAYALCDIVIDVAELEQRQRHVRRVPARITAVEDGDAGATRLRLRIPSSAIPTLGHAGVVRLVAPTAVAGVLQPLRLETGIVVVAWYPDTIRDGRPVGVLKIDEVVQIEIA